MEIELLDEGIQALLKSQDVMEYLSGMADGIAQRANAMYAADGYETSTAVGRYRARAKVRAATPHAVSSNLAHNTLLKALEG